MSIFSEQTTKLLNNYKKLLRRYLPDAEREKAIINLGIKRKSLKFDNDMILYNKAHRVLEDIRYWTQRLERNATEYSGIDGFYQHLEHFLSFYRVENNTVVHVSQKVSCALIQVIQMISSPKDAFSDQNASKLDGYIQTITKFGTKDQHTMLAKALNKQRAESTSTDLFTPAIDHFVKNYCDSVMQCE